MATRMAKKVITARLDVRGKIDLGDFNSRDFERLLNDPSSDVSVWEYLDDLEEDWSVDDGEGG
jgi:hypothetical protein